MNPLVEIGLHAGLGYVYGVLFDANPRLSAKVFVISCIAIKIFIDLPAAMMTRKKSERWVIKAFADPIAMLIQIVAMKRLELIGTCGVLIGLAFIPMSFMGALINVDKELKKGN